MADPYSGGRFLRTACYVCRDSRASCIESAMSFCFSCVGCPSGLR